VAIVSTGPRREETIVRGDALEPWLGERVAAVLAAEPAEGMRIYVCSFDGDDGRSWLALDGSDGAVSSRALVREAVSLLALCEIAEEAAGIEVEHPRLASPAYLDRIGTPDVAGALQSVDALLLEVEAAYKEELR
jgi:hypothetical protein